MKNKNKYLVLLTAFLIAFACNEKENELTSGDDFTLTTQSEVDGFKFSSGIRNLTIQSEGINDISNLAFQQVRNLIIENTAIENLTLSNLDAITSSLTIRGNEQLTTIDGLENLKFVDGRISIEDNNSLVDISGLLGLKLFAGELSITGNKLLGENEPCVKDELGFCVVKYLVESGIFNGNVILANNHPDAPTTVQKIGQIPGSDIISYTILSKEAAQNFAPLSDTIMDIRIAGTEIGNEELRLIGEKVIWVKGTVILENTSVTDTEGAFFDQAFCDGSIILRNNEQLVNAQGFKHYTKINGDLIIENCPNLTYWNSGGGGGVSFSSIERVEGNFKIDPATKLDSGGGGLSKLSYVGGDFEIVGDPSAGEIWNLDTWYNWGGGIKHIGGDLIFKNHYRVNGLGGFQGLEYIGGDVYILDNGGPDGVIPVMSQGPQIGFCLFRELYDKGVMKKEDVIIMLRAKSTEPYINFDELTPCN